ncbi:hypothetical protein CISIN_1g035070mg [Citrus sinensis]|uniref:Uncharacterized protein n=1 Tax=Citrus sinensis TaxID=2711 RepID=A0A067DZZ2_CITSI|nr:hypothetical protein CISIN_1g035070mg [Citrus sinensis]
MNKAFFRTKIKSKYKNAAKFGMKIKIISTRNFKRARRTKLNLTWKKIISKSFHRKDYFSCISIYIGVCVYVCVD